MTKKPADRTKRTCIGCSGCLVCEPDTLPSKPPDRMKEIHYRLESLIPGSPGATNPLIAVEMPWLLSQLSQLQAENQEREKLLATLTKHADWLIDENEELDTKIARLQAENERLLGVVNTVDAHAADVERDNFELERDLSREREKCARLEDVIGKAMDVCPAWIRDMFIAALSSAPSEKEVKS